MARRDEGCASIGCLGICFLAVVGMCSTGRSDGNAGSGPVPIDPPTTSAPALPPPPPPVIVEDARPPSTPRELHVGPRGGCYYIEADGDKNYVDRSECRRAGASADRQPFVSPMDGSPGAESSGAGPSSSAGAGTPIAPQPLVSAGSGYSAGDASRAGGFRQLHVGSRGGCYYISDSGSKRYVDRSECRRAGASAGPEPLTAIGSGSGGGSRRSAGGRQLHVGPRGGCYYINGSGNKTYVDRSECH